MMATADLDGDTQQELLLAKPDSKVGGKTGAGTIFLLLASKISRFKRP